MMTGPDNWKDNTRQPMEPRTKRKLKIIGLWRNGMDTYDIAMETGMTEAEVYNELARRG